MLRSFLLLICFLCTISACSQKAKEVCAKVTDRNWRASQWDQKIPSQTQCERSFERLSNATGVTENVWPCVFGGNPNFCKQEEGGSMSILTPLDGLLITQVNKADIPQLMTNLVIIK